MSALAVIVVVLLQIRTEREMARAVRAYERVRTLAPDNFSEGVFA